MPALCETVFRFIFGPAKLWRDPRTKQFYLLVSLEVETPDPTLESLKGIKGVDLGERYLAVMTTPGNKTQFFRGGAIRQKGEAFHRVRSRLQSQDTRGAKRRLRQLTLRERRFKADVNHCIAQAAVMPRHQVVLTVAMFPIRTVLARDCLSVVNHAD